MAKIDNNTLPSKILEENQAMDYHIKAWQKLIQKLASTKIIAWALSKFLHDVDQSMLSASNSQKSLTNVLSGVPIVVLTTIGAKSGIGQYPG